MYCFLFPVQSASVDSFHVCDWMYLVFSSMHLMIDITSVRCCSVVLARSAMVGMLMIRMDVVVG